MSYMDRFRVLKSTAGGQNDCAACEYSGPTIHHQCGSDRGGVVPKNKLRLPRHATKLLK